MLRPPVFGSFQAAQDRAVSLTKALSKRSGMRLKFLPFRFGLVATSACSCLSATFRPTNQSDLRPFELLWRCGGYCCRHAAQNAAWTQFIGTNTELFDY